MSSQLQAIDPQAPNSAAVILIGTSAKQAAAAAALNTEHSSGSTNSGIANDSCSNVFGPPLLRLPKFKNPVLRTSIIEIPCPTSAASHATRRLEVQPVWVQSGGVTAAAGGGQQAGQAIAGPIGLRGKEVAARRPRQQRQQRQPREEAAASATACGGEVAAGSGAAEPEEDEL